MPQFNRNQIQKRKIMFENLNELIELNLKLLNESPNKKLFRTDFKNEKGYSLKDSERLAKILDEKGLVYLESKNNEKCELTEFGHTVFKNGGWLKYLEYEKLKSEKAESKGVLEYENLKLQKETAEYQKSIRNKEDQIRNLTRDNLRLGNWDIRFRWWIAVGGFVSGFIIKYFIDN
jgi:hypothetical protein